MRDAGGLVDDGQDRAAAQGLDARRGDLLDVEPALPERGEHVRAIGAGFHQLGLGPGLARAGHTEIGHQRRRRQGRLEVSAVRQQGCRQAGGLCHQGGADGGDSQHRLAVPQRDHRGHLCRHAAARRDGGQSDPVDRRGVRRRSRRPLTMPRVSPQETALRLVDQGRDIAPAVDDDHGVAVGDRRGGLGR